MNPIEETAPEPSDIIAGKHHLDQALAEFDLPEFEDEIEFWVT